MQNARTLINLALTQDGDRYVFGGEIKPGTTNPDAYDCSEFIEWLCGVFSVSPRMPDGSWFQWQHCRNHNTLIPIDQAINTTGALLFRFVGDPSSRTRPSSAHVALSQGNGMTIEARSTRHGVGQWTAHNRGWTHAALIPGLDYSEVTMTLTPEEIQTVKEIHAAIKAENSNGSAFGFAVKLVRFMREIKELFKTATF